MRRIWIMLLAVALALVIAGPAGADKPNCDDPDSDHPACQDDEPGDELPMGGTMCDPAGYPEGIKGVQKDDFTFTLEGKKPGTCIDVMSEEGPWEVTVTGEGARYLGLIPRDSIAAGDSCGGWLLRSAANIYGDSPHTLGYNGPVPAAEINACGTDWAEWVAIEEWLDIEEWPDLNLDAVCAAFSDDEQCLVTEQLSVPHPLVLQVFMQSGGGSTTFEVDLPPLNPNWP
jgi:hypothetical protein